jgi:uncharacterized protein
MRTCRRFGLSLILALLGGAGGAMALDSSATGEAAVVIAAPHAEAIAMIPANSPLEAFESARSAYRAGDKTSALSALQFAAGQGHTGAQWMLGRMYAEGDGVGHDDSKAFEYFREVVRRASANEFVDSYDQRGEAPFVSSALVWLGSYYLEGIPGTAVKPNPAVAVRLFTDAAYNFGDPNAQYNLARMHLDGNGVKRDPSTGVRWLNLAAQKNHAPSRALLGHMMFTGELVKKQPEKGLMLMTLAREAAEQSGDPDQKWMIELQEKALAQSSEEQRHQAGGFLGRLIKPLAGNAAN